MPIRPVTAATCLDVAVGKYAARGASGNRTLMLAPLMSSEGHFYPYLKRRISGTIKLKLEFFNDTIFIIYSIPILSLFQICLGKCISCLCSFIIIIIWMDDQISKACDPSEKRSRFRVTSRAATSQKEMCLSAW